MTVLEDTHYPSQRNDACISPFNTHIQSIYDNESLIIEAINADQCIIKPLMTSRKSYRGSSAMLK